MKVVGERINREREKWIKDEWREKVAKKREPENALFELDFFLRLT